jgi:predicted AlkP superfamily phosphohydrolase/phosphomutase
LDPKLLPKELSLWEKKIRDIVLDYFRQLDGFIASIVALAGQEANVFIASDHGFAATTEIFYLNTWLNQHGYLEWADDAPVDADVSNKLGLEMPRKQSYLLDWTKTTAYALTPSSNGIHICVAGQRGEEGIRPEEYESFRGKLMEELLQLTNPATGKPVVSRIWTREEAFAGNQMQQAPDLTLTLNDGGFISILKSDVLIEPREVPLGAHHPEGIFIAGGPGIREGTVELSILDIAPVLLYNLGLPIPDDLEGHVPGEIFQPSLLQARPIRIGESTQPPDPFPQRSAEEDAEGRAKILARLKALGYVE